MAEADQNPQAPAAASLPPAQATLPLEPAPAAPSAAAVEPQAALAEPAPAAAPAAEPAQPDKPAVAPKIELTSDKPSMLEKVGAKDEPKPDVKADAKPAEPDKKVEAPKDGEKPKTEAKAEPAKVEAKPGDAPKPDDAAKIEADKAVAAKEASDRAEIAQLASTLKFELPEQLRSTAPDDPVYTGFVGAIAEATKNPQTAGQKLLNLHAQAMQKFADQKLADQHKAFNETRDGWSKDVMADKDIGGSGHQTAMKAIARMRDMLASNHKPGTTEYAADYKELTNFMRITGAGDHPAFLKMLHNAARFFDEPGLPPDNPRPPTGNGPRPSGRRETIYDHPRSNVNRQQQ